MILRKWVNIAAFLGVSVDWLTVPERSAELLELGIIREKTPKFGRVMTANARKLKRWYKEGGHVRL